MRAQIQEIVKRLQGAAEQLNGFDNLMHETLHGIANDLEAAIRPQWVPVAERLPIGSGLVFCMFSGSVQVLSYRPLQKEFVNCCGQVYVGVTHWHEIDYPEPPEVTT